MGPLEKTIGFMLCGVLFSVFMFGIVTVQTFTYFRTFNADRKLLRALVGIIWILELATAIAIAMGCYTMLITYFGQFGKLVRNPNSMNSAVPLAGTVDHLVKAIFIYRLYRFSGTLWIPLPLAILSVFLYAIVLLSTVRILDHVPLRPHAPELEWLLSVTFVGSAAQDIAVAASLCFYFRKRRQNAPKKTTVLLDKLFLYTIQTGVFTSIVAVAAAVSFFTMKDNHVWVVFLFVMHSSFSNALLSSLNNRSHLRAIQADLLDISSRFDRSGGADGHNIRFASNPDRSANRIRSVINIALEEVTIRTEADLTGP